MKNSKEMLKDLYKAFGKKKDGPDKMSNIANIMYEMGTKQENN